MADIKLTSSFDPSGIIQGLQQLRTKLRGLTSLANVNPANLAGFNNDLAQAEQKAEAINKIIGKGFSSKQDIQAFNDLNTEFARLTKSATKFMSTMSGEAFSHVSNEIATNFNNAMQSIQQQLDDTQAALKIKMQELGGVFGTKEMQNRVMNQITSGRGLDELYDEIEAGLKGKLTSIPRDTGARTTLVEARGQQAQGEAQVQAYKDLKTELKTLESSIRSQAKTEVAAAKTRYGNDISMSTVRSYDPFSADTIMDNVTRIPGMDAERFGEWVLKALADSIVGSTNPEEVFQKFMGTKLGNYNGRARYGRDIMPVDIDQQNAIRSAMGSAYMATPIGQAYTNAQATMQQRLQTEAVARGATDFETLKSDTNTMIQQWADYVKQMKVAIKNIEKQANIDTANEQKRTAAYIDLTNFQSLRAQQSQPGGLTDLANTYTQTLQQEAQAQQTRTDAMQDASDKSRALKTDTQALNQATETGVQTNINGAKALESQVSAINKVDSAFGHLMSRLQHFFSIYTIYNKIRQVVRQTFQDVQNLDKAFASIAMVTSKTVEDLWSSYSQYAQIANRLGQSTENAIKTSALYYQQGLETNEVLQLTESTMKLATLAAQDFETSTQELTAAIRAFHMEMSEGEHVTDVYSELAAHAAADVSNIAAGMSKVASIASSAGSSFENTAAFVTQIIETTQESGVNAGTALKTIVARFTELKENVDDAEESFEDLDYNKIDKALKTVGISLKDEQGQIRDFDDLIIELSGIWDTLSRNQQRYIATVAAGSRQQSRFIALLEDHDRLMELIGTATDSAGRSNQQFAKYADTINYRLTKLKNTWEQFRVNLINERKIKDILDAVQEGLKKVLSFDWVDWTVIAASFLIFGKIAAENFIKGFKGISVTALSLLTKTANLPYAFVDKFAGYGVARSGLSPLGTQGYGSIKLTDKQAKIMNAYGGKKDAGGFYPYKAGIPYQEGNMDAEALEKTYARYQKIMEQRAQALGATVATSLLVGITTVINKEDPGKVFIKTFTSGALAAAPSLISALVTSFSGGLTAIFTTLATTALPILGITAAIAGAAMAVRHFKKTAEENREANALQDSYYKATKEIEKLEEAQEKLGEKIAETQTKVDKASESYQNLSDKGKELKELQEKVMLTADEQERFNELSNEIAEVYPELVTAYTAEGNAVIELGEAYEELVKQKQAALQIEQKQLSEEQVEYDLLDYQKAVWEKTGMQGFNDFINGKGKEILDIYNRKGAGTDKSDIRQEIRNNIVGNTTSGQTAAYGRIYRKLLEDSTYFSDALSQTDDAEVAKKVGSIILDNEDALNEYLSYIEHAQENIIIYDQNIKTAKKKVLNSLNGYAEAVLLSSDFYNEEENKNVQKMMEAYLVSKKIDENQLRNEFAKNNTDIFTDQDEIDAFLSGKNNDIEGWSQFFSDSIKKALNDIDESDLDGFSTKIWESIYSDVDEDTTIGQIAKKVFSKDSGLSVEEQKVWYEQNQVQLESYAKKMEEIAKNFNGGVFTTYGPEGIGNIITGVGGGNGPVGQIAVWFEQLGTSAQDAFIEAYQAQEKFGSLAVTNFKEDMGNLASALEDEGFGADDFAKILNAGWQDYSFVDAESFWHNLSEEIDNPAAFEQIKEVFGKYFTKDDLIPDDFSDQITDKFNTFTDNLSTYNKIMKSVIENGGRFDAQDLQKLKKAKVPLQKIMKDGKIDEEAYTKWLKEQKDEIVNQINLFKQKKKIELENLNNLYAELKGRQAINKVAYQTMLTEAKISYAEQQKLTALYDEDANKMLANLQKEIDTVTEQVEDADINNYLTGIVDSAINEIDTAMEDRTKLIEEQAEKIAEANKKVADSYQNILDKQKDLADKQKELNDLLYGSDTDKSSLDPMYNYTQKIDYLKEQIDEAKDSLNDSTSANPQQSLKQWADNLHQLAVITDAASNTRKAAIKNIENSLSNGVSNWLANSEYGFDTNVSDFYRYNPAGFYEYNYDLYARMPKETKKFVDEQVKQMNELLKADKDAQKELKDQNKAFTDYQKKVRDDYISLQDKVVDMLKEKYQEEIDDKKEMYEALEKADNDYLDALQKAIDKERKLRDKQKKWDDLATKEKKLSLMRRDTSGANQKDIQSLEEEIKNDRQQLLDDSVDDVIDSLKEFYETQKESRDAEIEYQQSVLDNANLMKEAIDTILGWKSLEDMQAWMAEHTKNFENLSDETVIKMQEDWAEMYFNVQEYNAATQEDVKEIFDTTAEEIQEEMNNTSEALTKEAERALKEMTQNVEKSITSAEDAVTNAMKALTEAQEAYNKAIKEYNDLIAGSTSSHGGDDDNSNEDDGTADFGYNKTSAERLKELLISYQSNQGNQGALDAINNAASLELAGTKEKEIYDYLIQKMKIYKNSNSYAREAISKKVAQDIGEEWIDYLQVETPVTSTSTSSSLLPAEKDNIMDFYDETFLRYGNPVSYRDFVAGLEEDSEKWINWLHANEEFFTSSVKRNQFIAAARGYGYASGGLVNYTGPAWVDGTKSKPEAFLSAADTQRIGEAASILHDLPWGSISSLSGWLANPVNSYGDSNIEININVDSIATEDQVDYLINRMKDEITEAANPIGTTVIRR